MKRSDKLTLILVLGLVHGTSSMNPLLYNKNSKTNFEVQKLECSSNPAIVLFNCIYTPLKNTTGNFYLKFEYQKTVDAANSEIRFYVRSPNKKTYKSTPLKQKMDFCSLTANRNVPNLFSIFLPSDMDKLFPPCPFFGKIELNFTLPLVGVDPMFFQGGSYRLDITFTTGDEMLMWRLKAFGSAP